MPVNSASAKQLNNPDFRVALFDAAWKASAGKGKLSIFLKKKEGASRDGTRALKLDLREAAKSDRKNFNRAIRLAAVLELVKKCPTEPDGDMLQINALNEIFKAHPGKLTFNGVTLPTDNLREVEATISKVMLSDYFGAMLTKVLHPRVESALEAARQCPVTRQSALDHEHISRLFKDFFDVFSSPEIWSNKAVKQSLYEYYGLALNIAALEMFSDKTKFTKQDIALLKSTLKDVTLDGFENSAEAVQQRARQELFSDALDKIDLKKTQRSSCLK